MSMSIWEGVYSDFKQIQPVGLGYSGKKWEEISKKKIEKLLRENETRETIPHIIRYKESLLPFLVSIMGTEKRVVKILDFGGGMGQTYVMVKSSQISPAKMKYYIVDTKPVCHTGTHVFKGDKNIGFFTSLNSKIPHVDIVHIGSSLQYIQNWKKKLKELAGYGSKYFLFTDLPAGDIPTFATIQNYYDSKIPYWFFNIHDVVNALKSLHYHLVFKSSFSATILGKEQSLPLQNFPKSHRLDHTCNLLFNYE